MTIQFLAKNIMVVGDVMLDKYLAGGTERVSPEAPVTIVNVKDETLKIGGAGNVALNVKALGSNVRLLGLIGDDRAGEAIQQQLQQCGIKDDLLVCEQIDTTNKVRVLSQQQQVVRLDFESDGHTVDKTMLLERFEQALSDTDLVILSDYNKGTLSEIVKMIALANSQGVPVIIDPKGHDFSKYSGSAYLTPNRKEFETIVGPCGNLTVLAEQALSLIEKLNLEGLLITLSEDGMMLVQKNGNIEHLPANSKELIDVTGAGDTVISTFSTAFCNGYSPVAAMNLANISASIAVSRLGVANVSLDDLSAAFIKQRDIPRGLVDRDDLVDAVKHAQYLGHKVVFTNGCFDVIHAGHVTYLEKARQEGDKLIVAINSDESIKRLKGPSRPYYPLESRAAVLAALRPVDWVVVFDEDTPEALLEACRPDVLVKGGDYKADEIVGAEIVKAYNGQVKPIDHDFTHLSSTELINKFKNDSESPA